MSKEAKTNAMRILEQHKIPYEAMEYDTRDGLLDGVSVADKVGIPVEQVFKTLVTVGADGGCIVFEVPVARELDLKKAARAAGQKSVAMLEVKNLTKMTGYLKGGCSPVGMKKQYPTVIDQSAQKLTTMVVSGGRIGTQIRLTPEALRSLTGAIYADVVQ